MDTVFSNNTVTNPGSGAGGSAAELANTTDIVTNLVYFNQMQSNVTYTHSSALKSAEALVLGGNAGLRSTSAHSQNATVCKQSKA